MRKEFVFIEPKAPPAGQAGVASWMRTNLFNGPVNTVMTLICCYLIYLTIPPLITWAFIAAEWSPDYELCREAAGACWGYVDARFNLIIFGTYPHDEAWRPTLVMLILLGLVGISMLRAFWKPWLALIWIVGGVVAGTLMWGGVFGMTYVDTTRWGGLPLTIILTVVGVVFAFPLGLAMALGRQSKLPLIKSICVVYIEIIRGVPLISVLFMASVMFPLFLPDGVTIDKLLRAQVGIILFTAAYLAEIFRGGLQAIPKGQYEAADSLGLTYWQAMRMIILPQALRIVIPPLVGAIISMLKDTSLVFIVGLFDLLGTVKLSLTDPNWRAYSTEGYLFAAALFFTLCYSMALYSKYLEKDLRKGMSH